MDIEAIYTQYHKNVFNYIAFRISNPFDAEELASAVFENAMRGFRTYKPMLAPMEAWLIGIAKNVVTDYLRSMKHVRLVPLEDAAELASTQRQPEEMAVIHEENAALLQAMARLNDRERQVLSMKFATDLKNYEIAGLMRISESNVGVLTHRAIQKLRKILGEESASHAGKQPKPSSRVHRRMQEN